MRLKFGYSCWILITSDCIIVSTPFPNGYIVVASEQIALRRYDKPWSAPFPADVTDKLSDVIAAHQGCRKANALAITSVFAAAGHQGA